MIIFGDLHKYNIKTNHKQYYPYFIALLNIKLLINISRI